MLKNKETPEGGISGGDLFFSVVAQMNTFYLYSIRVFFK